jgi:hypothetical protein
MSIHLTLTYSLLEIDDSMLYIAQTLSLRLGLGIRLIEHARDMDLNRYPVRRLRVC